MTDPAAACPRCGAALEPDGACRWCGATGSAPPAPPVSAADLTVEERLRAIREWPEYGRLASVASVRPPLPWPFLFTSAIGVLFAVIAGSMLSFQKNNFSDPFFDRGRGTMELGPKLFVFVGIAVAAFGAFRFLRAVRAPLRAFPACVVGSRSDVVRGGDSSTTAHYVGLEDERGRRKEYRAVPSVLTLACEDEIGVAFIRLEELVAFRPVRGA